MTGEAGTAKKITAQPATSPVLVVVDVGHGSCAVLSEGFSTAVLDAGPGTSLMDYLDSSGVKEIDVLVISHSDEDHLGGAVAILSSDDYVVRHVLVNADSSKESLVWRDFRRTLSLEANRGVIPRVGVYQGLVPEWPGPRTKLEALAPSLENVLSGPGGRTAEDGEIITSNAASIVLRVLCDGEPRVLLAADMEDATLKDIVKNKVNAEADVLLFPHHGGRTGRGDVAEFSATLVVTVKPSTVLFSNGRGRYGTPRQEIMEVLTKIPNAYLACTQLSMSCSKTAPSGPSRHISNRYAAGAAKGACCAGSITINLETGSMQKEEVRAHKEFTVSLPTPLCRRSDLASH